MGRSNDMIVEIVRYSTRSSGGLLNTPINPRSVRAIRFVSYVAHGVDPFRSPLHIGNGTVLVAMVERRHETMLGIERDFIGNRAIGRGRPVSWPIPSGSLPGFALQQLPISATLEDSLERRVRFCA
jgi:hypothetical protein